MAFTDRQAELEYELKEALSLLSYFQQTKNAGVVSYAKEGLIHERINLLLKRNKQYEEANSSVGSTAAP